MVKLSRHSDHHNNGSKHLSNVKIVARKSTNANRLSRNGHLSISASIVVFGDAYKTKRTIGFMNIPQIVQEQKTYFASQQTKDISNRKKLLKRLLSEVTKREKDIVNALYLDFKKSEYESVMTETSIVISELKRTIKNINAWAKPQSVMPAFLNFPSSSRIYKEPYGTILIIAPWNYPYQLALVPLIGAIAAGNTVVVNHQN